MTQWTRDWTPGKRGHEQKRGSRDTPAFRGPGGQDLFLVIVHWETYEEGKSVTFQTVLRCFLPKIVMQKVPDWH